MTSDFIFEPLKIEQFEGFFDLSNEALLANNATWVTVDEKPGFPCRVSLEDAEVGERVLALTFMHHNAPSPYRSSGPIFVRETAQTAACTINEIPVMLHHRLLSIRAYNSAGFMIDAKVVPGMDLEQTIRTIFENSQVEYQQIHNANPGCFNCTVRRA